jgi:putative SOS response-associated peptidase YedK
MCGRFALHHPTDEVHERFAIQYPLFVLTPRYNIAPTQDIAVVTPARELVGMRWGLVPSWSRDGRPFINARAETVAEKPSFRANLRSRRVLVPCSGFYEWRTDGKAKTPMHIRLRGGRLRGGKLFAIAGLWEPGHGGSETPTCTLITVAANAAIAGVHERMPAILPPADEGAWLDPAHPDPVSLLRAAPAEDFELYEVSSRVNKAGADDPGMIERAGGLFGSLA